MSYINFFEDHNSLFVQKSKIDCLREASSIILTPTDEVFFQLEC